MELGKYIEVHEPLDGFPKVSSVCENRVEIGREAKVLVQTIDIQVEEYDIFNSLVQVPIGIVQCNIWDPLLGEERIESYLFYTKLYS